MIGFVDCRRWLAASGRPPTNRSHFSRLLVFAVSAITIITLLGGCGSPAPTTGHLAGHVYLQGGRNATIRPAEAKLTATPLDGATKVVRTVDTASDGSFSVDLPPGSYTLTGTLVTGITGGATSPQVVTITIGTTTDVKVYSYYP